MPEVLFSSAPASLRTEAEVAASEVVVALERALALAKPEGYVRIFVDEGKPMARLLRPWQDLVREKLHERADTLDEAVRRRVWYHLTNSYNSDGQWPPTLPDAPHIVHPFNYGYCFENLLAAELLIGGVDRQRLATDPFATIREILGCYGGTPTSLPTPAWTTPLLWPLWCRATAASFSSSSMRAPGRRRMRPKDGTRPVSPVSQP